MLNLNEKAPLVTNFFFCSIKPMHPFDEKNLAALEELFQLQCTPEEKKDIFHSLSRVLEYVNLLNEVNIQDVPSCNFVLSGMVKRVLREDIVCDLISPELFFSNVPERTDGMVRVPPILKGL